MSRSETKRRKVWATRYEASDEPYEGNPWWGSVVDTRREAVERCGRGGAVVRLIEARPGDVVRTKDEEVTLVSAVDRYTEAWETAYASHTDEARRAVTECGRNLRALLRGGR